MKRRNGIPDTRGNSTDRARRRAFLWVRHSTTGRSIRCFHCGKKIVKQDAMPDARGRIRGGFVVDRFPICGHDGGRYTHDNIVPSCIACNAKRGRNCQNGRCPQKAKMKTAHEPYQLALIPCPPDSAQEEILAPVAQLELRL